MSLTRIARVVASGALIIGTWCAAQTPSNRSESAPSRYQLFAASAEDFSESGARITTQQLFMVDTATGKVWRHVPSGPVKTQSGKPGFTPEAFVSVFVDQLEGNLADQMQKTVEYFEKHPATPIPPPR